MDENQTTPHIFAADNERMAALADRITNSETCLFGGRLMVVCLTLDNGHLVTGECCKADADGFDEALAMQVATERALEKVMVMEDFARREARHTSREDQGGRQ